jgi:hypothetical protein
MLIGYMRVSTGEQNLDLQRDAALNQLMSEGYDVRLEDVARLSPLGLKHINMLGRYAFTLPDFVARGELRPLRDPHTAGVDEA